MKVLRDTVSCAGTRALALIVTLGAGCEPVIPPPPIGDGYGRRDAASARDTASAADVPETPPDAVLCRERTGDLLIRAKADLAELDFVRVLDGDLIFQPIESLWNGSTREVRGSVSILGGSGGRVGAHVTLAALSAIGGDLEVGQTVKGLVDIYRLDHIDGSLVAHDGGWGFWTPALRSIGGGIDVRDASWLALTLDALETLGGPVHIERAAGLRALSLGTIDALGADDEAIVLVDNPDLADLSLGRLDTIEGAVRITGNPKLARSTIDLALERVLVRGGRTICGNLDDEPCP